MVREGFTLTLVVMILQGRGLWSAVLQVRQDLVPHSSHSRIFSSADSRKTSVWQVGHFTSFLQALLISAAALAFFRAW